jgi:hypothetical protein
MPIVAERTQPQAAGLLVLAVYGLFLSARSAFNRHFNEPLMLKHTNTKT